MPSRPCKYNRIDNAFRSRIIRSNLNEGLFYVETSECYGYPHETIRSIANFWRNWWISAQTQRWCSLSKFITCAHSMVSRDALCKSRDHHRISLSLVEWSFSISTPCCVSKIIQSQVGFTLKLMCYMIITMKNILENI